MSSNPTVKCATVCRTLLLAILPLLAVSCSKSEVDFAGPEVDRSGPDVVTSDQEVNASDVDTSDPEVDASDAEAVAKAFVVAIANGSVDEASRYVSPEQREDFQRAFSRESPQVPPNPTVQVQVNGNSAEFRIKEMEKFDVDMEMQDGKWWITK